MKERVIVHADINHCYAQIEEMKYPRLRDVPMAVGGHEEKRHGIILAKNDLAKKAGILTGESLREAREKCPDLLIIPPQYDDYIYYTGLVKNIYREYSSQVESFGLDEAWIDLTDYSRLFDDMRGTAAEIQRRVLEEVGLTVSVGVSWNKVFAKFGSDLKKPSGLVFITPENYRQIVWPAPVGDMLFVGPATERKLRERGLRTIGDLAVYPVMHLKKAMGSAGELISAFANGRDESPVAETDNTVPIKSVGNSMTMVHDVEDAESLRPVFWVLCEAIASRLKDAGMEGDVVSVSGRASSMEWFGRQRKLPRHTNVSEEILAAAVELFAESYDFSLPLRAVGASVSGLKPVGSFRQVSLFENEACHEAGRQLDLAMDRVREQYGFYAVRRACTLLDRDLTESNPKDEHVVHPVGYFQGRGFQDALHRKR